jgi:hypothetical protein
MMTNRRRLVLATIVLSMAVLVPGGAFAGQAPQQSDDDAPPPTIAEQIVPGGGPVEVVHSWALAPAGSDDPTEAGNRPSLSYVADAGTVIEDAVTLYNYGNAQLTFRVYGTDAFTNDAGQFDLVAGTEEPIDVGLWVTVAQEYITVDPGSQATIPITITIPDDAGPGDHTGAVLASNDASSTSPDGKTVLLDRRTGSRLFVRVNGPLTPELAVENLSTTYSPALNPLAGSATVTYTVVNRGNVRLGGSSAVSVAGPFGLGKQELPAVEFPELLPGGSIDVTAELTDVPAFGVAVTKVGLEADVAEGTDVTAPSRNGYTFALPIAVLLGMLAFLTALVGLRRYRRHRSTDTDSELGQDTDIEGALIRFDTESSTDVGHVHGEPQRT